MKHTDEYVVNGSKLMSDLQNAYVAQSLLIGETLGRSPWLLIDQARINAFADITEDPQFIHIDTARAATETPFGGTVAHGFLTLSMASRMMQDTVEPFEGQVMNLNAGFDRLRFLSPLRSGSSIRGVFELKEVKQTSSNQLRMVTKLTIEIEGADKPALVADWVNVAVFPDVE
jgi:acyl dehydratase